MTWLLAVGALLLLGVLLVRRTAKRAAGMPLLGALVSTPDGRRYTVQYDPLHPQTQPVERVRLILAYAARAILLTDRDAYQQLAIQVLLEEVGRSGPEDVGANRYEVLDEDWQPSKLRIEERAVTGGKVVKLRLGFVNVAARSLWVGLPASWFHNQFYHTLIALIETSLPDLDETLRGKLINSCAELAGMYRRDPTCRGSARAAATYPNDAFMMATSVVSH